MMSIKKLILILALSLLIFAVVVVYAFSYLNILGHTLIHVSPQVLSEIYAELTLASTSPNEVINKSAAIIEINLQALKSFTGYLEVNTTATNFTPSFSDAIVKASRNILCKYSHELASLTLSQTENIVRLPMTTYSFNRTAKKSGFFSVQVKEKTESYIVKMDAWRGG